MYSRQHLGALALLLLACCGVVLAGPVPAWAHGGTALSASLPAVAQAPSVPTAILVASAASAAKPMTISTQGAGDHVLWGLVLPLAALALLFRVPRRVVIAALIVLLLVVVAFETGVHAAHHIGDPGATARCAVASMAQHVGGATVTLATCGLALQPSVDGVVVSDAFVPLLRSLGPAQGRAPPSLAS